MLFRLFSPKFYSIYAPFSAKFGSVAIYALSPTKFVTIYALFFRKIFCPKTIFHVCVEEEDNAMRRRQAVKEEEEEDSTRRRRQTQYSPYVYTDYSDDQFSVTQEDSLVEDLQVPRDARQVIEIVFRLVGIETFVT